MAFIFTCGTHMFSSLLQGYENITAQCQNCGNFSARVYKRWHWFTFCFVPIIPFSLKPYHQVGCHICNFFQDVQYRPDVQAMMNNPQAGGGQAAQQQQQHHQQIPMQPYDNPQQAQQQQQQYKQSSPAQYA